MGLELNNVDVKLEKNGKIAIVQCVYDIGKIGVGKIKKKLLEARSVPNDQVFILALHGFTPQALKLCKEAGVIAILPKDIPFIDNNMGI